MFTGFYPIIDPSHATQWTALELAEQVLASGVSVIQYRDKTISVEEYKRIALEMAYFKIHNKFKWILNHHIQLVEIVGADGIHLTSKSVSVNEARKILGKDKIIGVSVHSIEEGLSAEKNGADYLTFGSIYPTHSKTGDYVIQGIDKLKTLTSQVTIPVFAVGGINTTNLSEVKATETAGFSVLGSLANSSNVEKTAREFLKAWG